MVVARMLISAMFVQNLHGRRSKKRYDNTHEREVKTIDRKGLLTLLLFADDTAEQIQYLIKELGISVWKRRKLKINVKKM